MFARPGVLLVGLVLGVSACATPSIPLATGSDSTVEREGKASATGNAAPREIQQRPLREIPRGEVSRIRDLIARRRGRVLTPLRDRDPTRLGIRYEIAVEEEVKRITDQARALSGTGALQRNNTLRDLARSHSMDMAGRGQLGLVSSDGKTAADRLTQEGIPFRSVGMRVHRAPPTSFTLSPTDTDETIRVRRENWLNQSQGDANPLDPSYYDVGVGAFQGADGNVYITAIFRQLTP